MNPHDVDITVSFVTLEIKGKVYCIMGHGRPDTVLVVLIILVT